MTGDVEMTGVATEAASLKSVRVMMSPARKKGRQLTSTRTTSWRSPEI
jgi:hypothetical protein